MVKCKRCGKNYCPSGNDFRFCYNCLQPFRRMVDELRLAYIHHYMHPDKKTIYVHDDSKRFKKG